MATGKKVEMIIPSEVRETGRDKYRMISLLLLLRCFGRVRLCDPIDGSPLASRIPGILQAKILEWVAISFSNT